MSTCGSSQQEQETLNTPVEGSCTESCSAVAEASQEQCAIAPVREHSSSRTQLRCSQLLSGCLVCLHVCMYGQFGQSVCEGKNVMCVKLNSLLLWSP